MNNEIGEIGRCRCGGIGFQRSHGLPDNYVVCYKCHAVWEVNDNKTQLLRLHSAFSESGIRLVIAGMYGGNIAYKPVEIQESLIDLMLD